MRVSIDIKDNGEYYYDYKSSINEHSLTGKHSFTLYKKIKHDTDSRILSFGSTDFKTFEKDLVFVVSVLVSEGIRHFSIRQYLV